MLDERRIEFGGEASTHWKTSRGHKAFSGAFSEDFHATTEWVFEIN